MTSDDAKTAASRAEELTLAAIDGAASDEELAELEQLIAADPEAAARHRALLAQEALLRGERPGADVADGVIQRIRGVQAERVERGVLARIGEVEAAQRAAGQAAAQVQAVERSLPWLGGRRFWQLAGAAAALAVVIAGARTAQVVAREAAPQETFVYGPRELAPGSTAAYRVLVRDGRAGAQLSGARVQLALWPAVGAAPVWRASAQTDERGMLLVRPTLPDAAAEGRYTLRVQTRAPNGDVLRMEQPVRVRRAYRVLVTTDKPLYQPGQTIHIRALALQSSTLRPAAGQRALLEIKDGKENKVFKQQLKLSRFGIASADFALADQVNLGRYTIAATVGDSPTERNVEVKRYRLPKLRVDLKLDRSYYGPGERLRGELTAMYTFGKPVVRGTVEVTLSHVVEQLKPFAVVSGVTDAGGQLRFDVPIPAYLVGQPIKQGDAPLSLEAVVVDPAGHKATRSADVTVTTHPLRLALLPEGGYGRVVPGVRNAAYVVTSYADGRAAQTDVAIWRTGNTDAPLTRGRTSSAGVLRVELPAAAPGAPLPLTVTARDTAGVTAELAQELRGDPRAETLLLRTDRAIYRAGDTAHLELFAAPSPARVFVDLIHDGRAVLVSATDVKQGRATLALDLPTDLAGTLQLHAYRVRADGQLVSDTRVIQVNRPDTLRIATSLSKPSYRPAERAVLDVAVTRADGSPAQVALGLAGVDEAVFALHEMRPGLERVYFTLQQELLRPRYEIHAQLPFAASDAVQQPQPADPVAAAALFTLASGARPPAPMVSETYGQRRSRLATEEQQQLRALVAALAIALALIFFALVLPLLGYNAYRMLQRRPLVGGSDDERARLSGALRWLGLWWPLGYFLPLLGAIVAGMIWRGRHDGEIVAAVLAGGSGLLALVKLVRWVVRLRRNALAAGAPLLRQLVCGLPVAYGVSWGLAFALAWTQTHPRALAEATVALIALSAIGAMLLVAATLPAAARTLLAPTTAWRWLRIALLRFLIIVALPAVALLFVTMGAMRKSAEPLAGLAPPPDAAALSMAAPANSDTSPATGEGGAPLKAPTRVRRDFPETLIWRPEVITDAQGKARVEIPLADSITTWRLGLSAVSARGELGAQDVPLPVLQPFFVDVDFPVALTQHDEVRVPVSLFSYLDRAQTVRLEVQREAWFELLGPVSQTLRIAPEQVASAGFRIRVLKPGEHKLTLRAHGSELADAVERSVRVEPDGRRVVQTINGQLGPGTTRHRIEIPADAIEGGGDLFVKIHPGTFSQVVEGLDNIFAMPSGCFEQTSSTTYPNVLVLDYLRRTKQIKPELELKATGFISQGYQRLLSYEVSGGGFEWFGQPPAHLVLTAYGLMEFADMARVSEVDPDVLQRTRRWLLSKQQGDGAFKPDEGGIAEGAINRYQGDVLRTTAYVTWAMLEAARDEQPGSDLGRALDYIAQHAGQSDDPYTLAACANALVAGKRSEARHVLARLAALKRDAGAHVHWESKGQSVVYAAGPALQIETTALAAYAFLRSGDGADTAHRALAWLVTQKDARGTWHSTQATVLALRALLAGTEGAGALKRPVNVGIAVNGQRVKALRITPQTSDVLRLVDLRAHARPGALELAISGDGRGMAYQIVAVHHLPWQQAERPAGAPPQRDELAIELAYDATELRANDELTATATLRYQRPGVAQMLIVDLGIPPGFELRAESFAALQERRVIERFSVAGQRVILYLRELRSGQPLRFSFKLRAKQPLRVSTPPSRVYKYYEPDVQAATKPVKLVAI